MVVNGVSSPSACAIPIAMAVLPVPGLPASRMARPAILPCWLCEVRDARSVDEIARVTRTYIVEWCERLDE